MTKGEIAHNEQFLLLSLFLTLWLIFKCLPTREIGYWFVVSGKVLHPYKAHDLKCSIIRQQRILFFSNEKVRIYIFIILYNLHVLLMTFKLRSLENKNRIEVSFYFEHFSISYIFSTDFPTYIKSTAADNLEIVEAKLCSSVFLLSPHVFKNPLLQMHHNVAA